MKERFAYVALAIFVSGAVSCISASYKAEAAEGVRWEAFEDSSTSKAEAADGVRWEAFEDSSTSGTIVFTRMASGKKDNYREIYLMDSGSRTVERVTRNKYNDNYARLSPDGKKIVFESIRKDMDGNGRLDDEDRDIYIINSDGTGERRLLDESVFKGHPQWSPDGKKILFVSKRDGKPDIFVVDTDGASLVRLTDTGDCVDPAWSPDGKKIVYLRFKAKWLVPMTSLETELWTMNADGTDKKSLFNSEAGVKGGFKHSIFDPAWSPDGKHIAFMRRMGKKGNYGFGVWQVFVVNADGTNPRNMDRDKGFYGYPHWSPDSRWLVVWGFNTGKGTVPHLMLINVETRKHMDLTTERSFNDEMPFWR